MRRHYRLLLCPWLNEHPCPNVVRWYAIIKAQRSPKDVPSRRRRGQVTRRAVTHSSCCPCLVDGRDQPRPCQPAPALVPPFGFPPPRHPHQYKVSPKGGTHPATRKNCQRVSLGGGCCDPRFRVALRGTCAARMVPLVSLLMGQTRRSTFLLASNVFSPLISVHIQLK